MKEIKIGDEVYAILVSKKDSKEGTQWIGKSFEPLQGSRMQYPAGTIFRVHRHILNPRMIQRTQEAFVVISGKIAVDMHDSKFRPIGTLEASAGEAIFVYRGAHGVRILKKSLLYEIKAGAFSYVSDDKEMMDDKS